MSVTIKTIRPLYEPTEKRSMHVVILGSGMGTNIEALLKVQNPPFQIKALFTDRLCRIHEIGALAGIPVIYHSFADFFQKEGVSDKKDYSTRLKYDQENIRLILECAEKYQFSIDMILLAGYMHLLYAPFVRFFENKIINIHPADLIEIDPEGRRLYIGCDAVYQALCDGKSRTRSSVILVDEDIDTGPILVSGPWVPYEGEYPITKESAKHHQKKQKALSDWPACTTALTLIAQGRIAIDAKKNVYVDEKLQFTKGAG